VTDCELLDTCPYYNGIADMSEYFREAYCRRDYRWCGRYMVWKNLERERTSRFDNSCTEVKGADKYHDSGKAAG